jgi:hypothetical protein
MAHDIANAVHDLAQPMRPRATAPLANRQKRLQSRPLLVRQVTRISLTTPVVATAILGSPHHRHACQLSYTNHRILQSVQFDLKPLSQRTLNMVEIEIGVLHGQCLDRRIGERDVLVSEIKTWQQQ